MSLPRYAKYKPSGVEWLGDVPEHWSIHRLKRLCRVMPSNVDKKSHEGETPVLLCNYTDVYYNDHIVAGMEFMPATASAEQIEKFTLKSGDTIITKDSETADDIAAAAFVPDDLPGVVCGYHLAVLRPMEPGSESFFKWLFGGAHAQAAVEVRANGLTRVGLGTHDIENLEIALPAPNERRAIAVFLDRETAKIDALVAEQERLSVLLKEKRQAVISHAVTKGLNPNAPMKDSGIEWLGQVPAHWQVKRLKHAVPQVTVGIVVEPSKHYAEQGVPALRSLNVRPGSIFMENLVFITQAGHELHSKSKLRTGDLVAVRSGQPGTTAVIPPELDGCNCIDLLIMRRPLVGSEHFLSWYLASDSAVVQFSAGSGGAIQQHFNVSTAADLIVPWPPATEQAEIAEAVARSTGQIDALLAAVQHGIEVLRERRAALITAAVTGQIDVRPESMRTAA